MGYRLQKVISFRQGDTAAFAANASDSLSAALSKLVQPSPSRHFWRTILSERFR